MEQPITQLALMVGLFFPLNVEGSKVWHVARTACPAEGSGTQSDPYCSIQVAADLSDEGDLILVGPGIYEEALFFRFPSGAVDIRATAGPAQTVIQGNLGTPVVYFERTHGRLTGFTISGGMGGVLCFASAPVIENCVVTDNVAPNGGGIRLEAGSDATFRNCLILKNRAEQFLGGGAMLSHSNPRFERCTIANNFARNGGGIYAHESSVQLWQCSIAENVAEPTNGQHGYGGGLVLSGGSPLLFGCRILGNRADAAAGIGHGGPLGKVWNSEIRENMATRVAGGLLCNGSSLQIVNCLIALNSAGFSGGGVYCYSAGNPVISNCTIARNSAEGGGGLFVASHSFPNLTNSIVWGNTENQIQVEGDSSVLARYSIVQSGWPGTGNTSLSPRFRSLGEFRVFLDSPAIDSGISDAVHEGDPFTDLDGHARVLCHAIDRGAYEFGIGDVNCDRRVDLVDWVFWESCASGPEAILPDPTCIGFDFNADSKTDLTDLAGWQNSFED